MTCKKCKKELPEGMDYCPGCGYVPKQKEQSAMPGFFSRLLLALAGSAAILVYWWIY